MTDSNPAIDRVKVPVWVKPMKEFRGLELMGMFYTVFSRDKDWMDAVGLGRNNPRHAPRVSYREVER